MQLGHRERQTPLQLGDVLKLLPLQSLILGSKVRTLGDPQRSDLTPPLPKTYLGKKDSSIGPFPFSGAAHCKQTNTHVLSYIWRAHVNRTRLSLSRASDTLLTSGWHCSFPISLFVLFLCPLDHQALDESGRSLARSFFFTPRMFSGESTQFEEIYKVKLDVSHGAYKFETLFG